MRAIKAHIFIEHMRQPGFALHGSYHCPLFCGRDCLREPAALCVSSCEGPEKLRVFAT